MTEATDGEDRGSAVEERGAAKQLADAADEALWQKSTRFETLEVLGRGGMGAVLRVVDRSTGNEVALKRLLLRGGAAESAQIVSLFEREFHTLSQLSHPRIIKVFDYGVDDAGPYYTMELLDGQDLRNQVPMPWQTLCRVGRDIASSLAILHARRIVHRDVSPANIRCGVDGQAKLIDFGAMAPMGPVEEVVGTAPFVAPEMLRAGVLDGRYDLYALGATLYLGISGRLAYAERKLSRLEDVWKAPVRTLKDLCPQVPDGLNALVMELISLDPLVRPQNAAQVFERLSAIGELPHEEGLDVAEAYLSVPTLTGRDAELGRCRRRLLRAKRGKGRTILVSGDAGVGRSRFLDSVVLEAKLLGLTVVRAGKSDGGEFGVVRRLASGVVRAHPEALPAEGPVHRLLGGGAPSGPRDRWVQDINTWFIECSQKWPMALVVDDVHASDELSLAILGTLLGELRGKPLLVLCAETRGAPCRAPAAMRMIAETAETFELEALSESNTRCLVASMFSEGDNLDVLTSVLYAHASGNPAETVHAAQSLLGAGVIGYSAGAWHLPAEPSALRGALPKDEGLQDKLQALDSDARRIALLTALDVHQTIGPGDYSALLGGLEAPRVYGAIQELVAGRILVELGVGGVSLMRESYHTEIVESFSLAERGRAHRSLAEWYETMGRFPAAGHHAACAHDWDSLLNNVQKSFLEADYAEAWQFELTGTDTLEGLIHHLDKREDSLPCLLALRAKFLTLCAERDEWGRVMRHYPPVLSGLQSRCGLTDYAMLSDLPEEQRLQEAIARAEARYAHIEGGLSFLAALRMLPTVLLTVASVAVLGDDAEVTDELPSLEPLFPLSPAYPLVERLVGSIVACCRGRVDLARSESEKAYLELIAGPIEGLAKLSQLRLFRFALGFLQGIEAAMGRPEVLERTDPDSGRNTKTMARERHAYYVAMGDVEHAASARKRLERMEIAEGSEKTFPTSWETEYSHNSLTGNLEGLKRRERQALYVAEELPKWEQRVELSRLAQLLCGTASEAILARTVALCNRTMWGTSDYRNSHRLQFECLFGLGRYEEARALMQAAVDRLGRPGDWFDGFEILLARAEAALGMHESARAHADRYAKMYLASGVRGVLVGRMYEEVARVGLLTEDVALFRQNAERCAEQYKSGFNPALTARYEFLIREAKARKVAISEELEHAAEFPDRAPVSALVSQFNTQISTCLSGGERLQTLLTLAVARSGASGGSLYIARAEGLRREATEGCREALTELDGSALEFWQSELAMDDLVTETEFDSTYSGTDVCEQPSGETATSRLTPLMLSDADEEDPRRCGVLVLVAPVGGDLTLDPHVTAALSLVILQYEQVSCGVWQG